MAATETDLLFNQDPWREAQWNNILHLNCCQQLVRLVWREGATDVDVWLTPLWSQYETPDCWSPTLPFPACTARTHSSSIPSTQTAPRVSCLWDTSKLNSLGLLKSTKANYSVIFCKAYARKISHICWWLDQLCNLGLRRQDIVRWAFCIMQCNPNGDVAFLHVPPLPSRWEEKKLSSCWKWWSGFTFIYISPQSEKMLFRTETWNPDPEHRLCAFVFQQTPVGSSNRILQVW